MLTRQQNIFLAKKTFTELVFNAAYIEGCKKGTVGVGDFISSIPVKENVLKEIERINGINGSVDRALEYFAYACKQQLFWDGNKRTSTMIASKILIENGEGILTIGKNNAEEFNITLNNWY